MKRFHKQHLIPLGAVLVILLAVALILALVMGGEDEPTVSSDSAGITQAPPDDENGMESNGYELIATIEDDTLAPGEEWNIHLDVRRDGESVPIVDLSAVLEYAGEEPVRDSYEMKVREPLYSSSLADTSVSYIAPIGAYDLVVTLYDYEAEQPIRWHLEHFLTVVPPPYEDYRVSATLSPNILKPGEPLDGKLDITVSWGQVVKSMGGWTAEMRLVGGDGDYSFTICDEQTWLDLFSSSSASQTVELHPDPIPADAPEGIYELVVSIENYGYTWKFPNFLLVWPEDKTLRPDDGTAVSYHTCTATVDNPVVTYGDAPEVSIRVTRAGEACTDFAAYLVYRGDSEAKGEHPDRVPLFYDEARGCYSFLTEENMLTGDYDLAVVCPHEMTVIPSFVTVVVTVEENTSIRTTQSSSNGYELEAYIGDSQLSPGEAWDIDLTIRRNGEICQEFDLYAYLHKDGEDGRAYDMTVQVPRYFSIAPELIVSWFAPAGSYDLVVSYTTFNGGETHSWVVKDFLTVLPSEEFVLGKNARA